MTAVAGIFGAEHFPQFTGETLQLFLLGTESYPRNFLRPALMRRCVAVERRRRGVGLMTVPLADVTTIFCVW